MINLNIHSSEIAVYLSILLRISIVLFMTPVFTSASIPNTIKSLVALILASIIYMLPGISVAPLPLEPAQLVWTTLGEIVLGLMMGVTFYLVFGAFELAGELVSFQMGLSFAQVADPQNGTQIAVVSRWFQIIAMLLFFTLNCHHLVLKAIVESFRTIPIGGFILDAATFGRIIALAAQLFVISLKIAAPILVALLLTHAGLGLISKFAPQLNILMASFPITILIGLLCLTLSISVWGGAMTSYIEKIFHFIHLVMHV